MRIEHKHNRKFVICDNLEEFFTEFKNYRAKKSKISTKENYSEHVFPYSPIDKNVIDGKEPPKLFLVDLDYEEPKTEPFWSLGLDILPANIKSVDMGSEWDKKEREIIKILHEIWENGSADTSVLDLNWPISDKKSEKPLPSLSDKSNKVVWWVGGTILFLIFVCWLAFLFRKKYIK